MKIFAYRVVQKGPRTFEDVLARIAARPLADRVFDGRHVALRLEEYQVEADGWVSFDLASPRTGHGPGRMGTAQPFSEIDLPEGDLFGEDTALVYDPETRYLAVQYNHIGPRIGRIQGYLMAADLSLGGLRPKIEGESDFDRCGFQFGAVLRPDAYDRLNHMGIVRSLEFAVSVPGARAGDRDLGRSLNQILDAPLPEGVETLNISLTAAPDRRGRLARNLVAEITNGLQRLGGSLKKANVRGARDDDASYEEIDLVNERLVREALVAMGKGQRYPIADRWQALRTALHDWIHNGDLEVAE